MESLDYNLDLISDLPLELQVIMFGSFSDPEKTLCAMTCQWCYNMIKKYWPNLKTTPNQLLRYSSQTGSINLLRLAKTAGAKRIWRRGKPKPTDSAWTKKMRNRYVPQREQDKRNHLATYTPEAVVAAKRGHVEYMKLLKELGVVSFSGCILAAASCGHLECMKLAKKWNDEVKAKRRRPTRGRWKYKLAREEVEHLSFLNMILSASASHGHIDCMKQIRWWGAYKYEGALKGAKRNQHQECVEVLEKWIIKQNS